MTESDYKSFCASMEQLDHSIALEVDGVNKKSDSIRLEAAMIIMGNALANYQRLVGAVPPSITVPA